MYRQGDVIHRIDSLSFGLELYLQIPDLKNGVSHKEAVLMWGKELTVILASCF